MLRDIEKIGTTLVALYPEIRGELDIEQLRDTIGDDLEPGAPPGVPVAAIRLRSARSQMVVALEANKVQVADQSETRPAREDFVGKALSVLTQIGVAAATVHGWNLDVTFKTNADRAGAEIGSRLINERTQEALGAALVGATVQLTYEKGDVRYILRVEPRRERLDSDVFFGHLTAHYELPVPPDEQTAAAELQHAHDELFRALGEMFP